MTFDQESIHSQSSNQPSNQTNVIYDTLSSIVLTLAVLFLSVSFLWGGTPHCYTTGDPGYAPNPKDAITVCHTSDSTEEGLYFDTPVPQVGVTFGQVAYNLSPMRIAPGAYRILIHSSPNKLNDATNCPLPSPGLPPSGGIGIGYPPFPAAATYPNFPSPPVVGRQFANPLYKYFTCARGDDIQESFFNTTDPSSTGPYTISNAAQFVLTGQTSIPAAANYYGATSGLMTVTLTAPLNAGTAYTSLSVSPLTFTIGGVAPSSVSYLSTGLSIGTGANPEVVQLAPLALAPTLASPLVLQTFYTNISVSPGLQNPLPPKTGLILQSGSSTLGVTTSDAATTLTSALSSGNNYTTLNVSALPYTIDAGTVLTLGRGAPNNHIPQQVTVSSMASAGSTSISVNSFTANGNYPSTTEILSPSIPANATTIPVVPFYAALNLPTGASVARSSLPLGATTIPIVSFTPTASYPVGTTVTLLNDAAGGVGNQMTIAGRYYYPWNDQYYYSFFIGEDRTASPPVCPWAAANGTCNSREVLEEARTTDFVNWEFYTSLPCGPWVSASSVTSTCYPTPVKDRNGNPIVANYRNTSGDVQGLLGSINQVYTSADGIHTFRYFYSDHPAATSANSWQSDLQYFNVYVREASTDDPNAFDATGNIIWSAPSLIASNVPTGGFISIAKAHGLNRWAVALTDVNGVDPANHFTYDYRIEYSADMTNLPHTQWLAPLTHLLNNLTSGSGQNYLNVQTGRLYPTALSTKDGNNQSKGYGDAIAQVFYMTDRDGNVTAPDNGTPGYQRGGMLTWTDFPFIYNHTAVDTPTPLTLGIYGAKGYQASFDVSNNIHGELLANGDFATGVFTGNPTFDGWALFDASGGGTNYPPSVFRNGMEPNGQVAIVGPSNLSLPESPGGSGMYQIVNIPSGASNATLSFSYLNECPAGSSSGDYQTAYVYNGDTGAVTWVVLPACDDSRTWKTASADLSSFIGHPAIVYFVTHKQSTVNTGAVAMILGCWKQCVSLSVN